MRNIIYRLYDKLKERIDDEIESYPLEIRDLGKNHYIIGDHVKLYDKKNPFFGGARHNQFLLYINFVDDYFLNITEPRNYTLPSERIYHIIVEVMEEIIKEKDFKGIVNIDFKKYISYNNRKPEKKTIVNGSDYKHNVELALNIPGINKGISQAATFDWSYGDYAKFDIKVTKEGLILQNGKKNRHREIIKNPGDIRKMINLLEGREQEINQWKEDVNELLMSRGEIYEWTSHSYLRIGKERFRIGNIRNIIKSGIFYYTFYAGRGKDINFYSTEQMMDYIEIVLEKINKK